MDTKALLCRWLGVEPLDVDLPWSDGLLVVSKLSSDRENVALRERGVQFFVQVVYHRAFKGKWTSVAEYRKVVYAVLAEVFSSDESYLGKLMTLKYYAGLPGSVWSTFLSMVRQEVLGEACTMEDLCTPILTATDDSLGYRMEMLRAAWSQKLSSEDPLLVWRHYMIQTRKEALDPWPVSKDWLRALDLWYKLNGLGSIEGIFEDKSYSEVEAAWRTLPANWLEEFERLVLALCNTMRYDTTSDELPASIRSQVSLVLSCVCVHLATGCATSTFGVSLLRVLKKLPWCADAFVPVSGKLDVSLRDVVDRVLTESDAVSSVMLLHWMLSEHEVLDKAGWRYAVLQALCGECFDGLESRIDIASWLCWLFPNLPAFWRDRMLHYVYFDFVRSGSEDERGFISFLGVPIRSFTVEDGELSVSSALKSMYDILCEQVGHVELQSMFSETCGLYRARAFLGLGFQLHVHWMLAYGQTALRWLCPLDVEFMGALSGLLSQSNWREMRDNRVPAVVLDKLFKARSLPSWRALLLELQDGERVCAHNAEYDSLLWRFCVVQEFSAQIEHLSFIYKYVTDADLKTMSENPRWFKNMAWSNKVYPVLTSRAHEAILETIPLSTWYRWYVQLNSVDVLIALLNWIQSQGSVLPDVKSMSLRSLLAYRFSGILSADDVKRMWRSVEAVLENSSMDSVGGELYTRLLEMEELLERGLKAKTSSEIPLINVPYEYFGKRYRVSILPPGDVRALIVGTLVGCCQHIGGAAKDIALSSYTNPLQGVLLVEDEFGRAIAESFVWAQLNDDDDKKALLSSMLVPYDQVSAEPFQGVLVLDSFESLYDLGMEYGEPDHGVFDTGLHAGIVQHGYLLATLALQRAGWVIAASTDQAAATMLTSVTTSLHADLEDDWPLSVYGHLGYTDVTPRYVEALCVKEEDIACQREKMAGWLSAHANN